MFKNHNFRNFIKLFLGSSLGQILALALYTYIARLYSPQDFSEFGFIASVTLLLSVFATGQFHTAILIPESNEEADALIGLSTCFTIVSSFVVGIFLLIFYSQYFIIAIYLFFYSMIEIQRMYFIRHKFFNASAVTQFSFRLSANIAKIIPFFVSLKSTGLVLSEIFSIFIVTCYGFGKRIFNVSFDKRVLRRYKSFPTFNAVSMALNLILADFPILFWAFKYSKTEVGYFVMAQKIILVPAWVVSQALQNSTIHHMIESDRPRSNFYKSTAVLVVLSILGIFSFQILGKEFLTLFLGPIWSNGFEVFRILVFLLFSRFMFYLNQGIFIQLNMGKTMFFLRFIQIVSLFFLNLLDLDFDSALKGYVIIELIIEASLFVLASKHIKPPFVFRNNLKEMNL